MRYIDEEGMRHTMELALATIDSNTHLHVSFDVDFLDAEIAPGVGTTVQGGPTYREAQLCMEMIADTGAHGLARRDGAQPGARRPQPDRRDRRRPDREPVRQEHADAPLGEARRARVAELEVGHPRCSRAMQLVLADLVVSVVLAMFSALALRATLPSWRLSSAAIRPRSKLSTASPSD